MKKLIVILLLVGLISSCTDNNMARYYGGTETVNLPKGERLVTATWKETQIWYLTEPMPEGYIPTSKTFREKSQYGMMEGTIIFVESK